MSKANDTCYRTHIEEGRHSWTVFGQYIRTYRLRGEVRILPTISLNRLDNSISIEFICWGISNGLPF